MNAVPRSITYNEASLQCHALLQCYAALLIKSCPLCLFYQAANNEPVPPCNACEQDPSLQPGVCWVRTVVTTQFSANLKPSKQ